MNNEDSGLVTPVLCHPLLNYRCSLPGLQATGQQTTCKRESSEFFFGLFPLQGHHSQSSSTSLCLLLILRCPSGISTSSCVSPIFKFKLVPVKSSKFFFYLNIAIFKKDPLLFSFILELIACSSRSLHPSPVINISKLFVINQIFVLQ